MKMIRTTAENVRGIVIDGQRQLEMEREMRQSREADAVGGGYTLPSSWQAGPTPEQAASTTQNESSMTIY